MFRLESTCLGRRMENLRAKEGRSPILTVKYQIRVEIVFAIFICAETSILLMEGGSLMQSSS